ncbi:putative subtilisin-like protease [Heliomicrobium modesticaldum Ice1]|uniref:Subtilisin-like protease n=1 Tax=Heliobacterium modesticaldum (strain ATCC 51547 / Ice1) TaxID=498761 RepID=B0THL2_HELMI|nr:S8 family serine peptidase [Heliomicrobium modesticaldum]ABZ83450.1 putative subtilisin-like protease [Heliomicrobium modesticaldum Ice1]
MERVDSLRRSIALGLILALPWAGLPFGKTAVAAERPIGTPTTTQAKPELLNDRTRDIIGASLVAVPEVIHKKGLQGQGEVIAIADSGLDSGDLNNLHPDFRNLSGSLPKVLNIRSWAGGPTADTSGHGTHMAGIAAGTGAASQGKYRGMAPQASLYIQGIVDKAGQVTPPEDISKLYEPAYKANAYIHVNGWGTPGNTYNRTALETDRFSFQHRDFLAIFGAGNRGPDPNSLTCEGTSKNALVVGASVSARPSGSSGGGDVQQMAELSSRGPTTDGRIKPDLLAPGMAIISTTPRLAGLPEDEAHLYRRMQGTSMAAAATGGAAALLRQYYREVEHREPSAALLKAALINGARSHVENMSGYENTFGLLDVGRSILSLYEQSFASIDEKEGVAAEEKKSYEVKAWTEKAPLKVTLAWTDPIDREGRLVNDLDVTVIAPDGTTYTGNAHMGVIGRDRKNNVEQIIITKPQSGTYRIIVSAVTIARDRQPFAVVMGQPLAEAESAGGAPLQDIARNQTLTLRWVINDQVRKEPEVTFPKGTQCYLSPRRIYAVARAVRLRSVDVTIIGGKSYILPTEPELTDQAYVLDTQAALTINGQATPLWPSEAKGAAALVWVHPGNQKAVQIDAVYRKVEGRLEQWSVEKKELKLFGDSKVYRAPPDISIQTVTKPEGEACVPGPIIANRPADSVLPGSQVRLTIDPQRQIVTQIEVVRTVVQGLLIKSPNKEEVELEGYGALPVLSGATILRNGEKVDLRELRSGDYVQANLIGQERKAYGVVATSQSLWGKIVFASAKDKMIYFTDQFQRLHRCELKADALLQRWDMPVDLTTIPIGAWGWITLGSDNNIQALRIVESEAPRMALVQQFDKRKKEILTNKNERIPLFSLTAVTKQGLPVPPELITAGATIQWSPIAESSTTGGQYAGAVTIAGTGKPANESTLTLNASLIPVDRQVFILGKTNGSDIWIYPSVGNEKIHVPVLANGEYAWWTEPVPGESGYQIVATSAGGQVVGRYLTIPRWNGGELKDLSGHWAEKTLTRLWERGIIRGYPDRTFRPDEPIERQDLRLLYGRLFGGDDGPPSSGFWAQQGIVTEKQLVQFVQEKRARMGIPTEPLPNWPHMAESGLSKPDKAATRARAAVLLDELIQSIEKHKKAESGR